MSLTRDEFLAIDDLDIEEVTFPEHIIGWGGKTIFIRSLSRGEQDTYLKRQMGDAHVRMDMKKNSSSELPLAGMFGNDPWLCARGACDEKGKPIFTDKDIVSIQSKNGEAIGWLAKRILEHSGMAEDIAVLNGEKTANQALEDEVKN